MIEFIGNLKLEKESETPNNSIKGNENNKKVELDTKKDQQTRKRTVNKQSLLESGAHFGHRTRDWHPKTMPFLYGTHNQIHIINLRETLKAWPKVKQIIINTAALGLDVLFVGTKKQASEAIKKHAEFCGQPYVDKKWKGGTLTNLKTMRKRIEYLNKIDTILNDPEKSKRYVKKELSNLKKERDRLEYALGGIKNMNCYPGLMFVVDTRRERTAVLEAKKLSIPVISLLDSNCNPDDVDFFIPANDDAIKTVDLFLEAVAEAVMEGKQLAAQRAQTGEEWDTSELLFGVDNDEHQQPTVE